MDENNKSIFLPSLTNGLILGVALIGFSLILYILELTENVWVASLAYVILAVILYFAITSFRDKQQNGFLTYGKGVGVGTLTGIFGAILLAIFTFIYVSYIDPGIIEQALIKGEESILESNPEIGDAELEQALGFMEMVTTPTMMSLIAIFWYALVSLVFSLLISIFAKREDTNIA